ncbi:MAG: metal-sensitive transcriptional regulator [Candidatus Levybacteria bacterium]|nr:metal-sensitive transcriptional regulator [Candidatus Levybacteria bacterium]
MFKPKDHKEKVLHRLKIAQGHLRRVQEMVEKGYYCIDVLHQSHAVQKALEETDNVIMENHLKTCAAEAIRKGNQEEAIKEVMEVFKRTGK